MPGGTVVVADVADVAVVLLCGWAAWMAWQHRRRSPLAVPAVICHLELLTAAALSGVAGLTPSPLHGALDLAARAPVLSAGAAFLWTAAATAGRYRTAARRLWMVVTAASAAVWVCQPWTGVLHPVAAADGGLEPSGPVHATLTLTGLALTALAGAWLVAVWCRSSGRRRRQARLVVHGSLVPLVLSVADGALHGGAIHDERIALYLLAGSVPLVAGLRRGVFGTRPVARHRVVERVSDGVLVLDADMCVLDANPAAVALLGRARPEGSGPPSPDDVLGSPLHDLAPHASGSVGRDGRHEVCLALPDGEWLDLEITRDSLLDRRGDVVQVVLLVRDVTEVNDQARRLEQTNAQLSRQLETIGSLRAELAELAVRDELTGLYNRRHLTAQLDAELLRAARDGAPVSVVVLDVDHFKVVNDTHGHLSGDEVLRAISRALRDHTRPGDVVCRFGGEEFVVLLPGCTQASAVLRAEQLRLAVGAVGVPIGSGVLSVTISAGVATARPGAGDRGDAGLTQAAAALLTAADEALYRAKQAGRNQVLVG